MSDENDKVVVKVFLVRTTYKGGRLHVGIYRHGKMISRGESSVSGFQLCWSTLADTLLCGIDRYEDTPNKDKKLAEDITKSMRGWLESPNEEIQACVRSIKELDTQTCQFASTHQWSREYRNGYVLWCEQYGKDQDFCKEMAVSLPESVISALDEFHERHPDHIDWLKHHQEWLEGIEKDAIRVSTWEEMDAKPEYEYFLAALEKRPKTAHLTLDIKTGWHHGRKVLYDAKIVSERAIRGYVRSHDYYNEFKDVELFGSKWEWQGDELVLVNSESLGKAHLNPAFLEGHEFVLRGKTKLAKWRKKNVDIPLFKIGPGP